MINPERRKFFRLKSQYVVKHIKFILPGADMIDAKQGISKDFSAGGVLFESNQGYNVGDIVRLEIYVPGWEKYKPEFYKPGRVSKSEPVLVLGKVVRVELLGLGRYDIGVSFMGIDDGHQLALIKYIQTHK